MSRVLSTLRKIWFQSIMTWPFHLPKLAWRGQKQALVVDPEVARFVCGYVVGTAPQMPGTTERYTMEVNNELCSGDVFVSMATMAGKIINLRMEGNHRRISISISISMSTSHTF